MGPEMSYVNSQKVNIPSYSRALDIELDEDGGEESFEAFQIYLDVVYKHIDKELERTFNDPDIFDLDDEGFPLKRDITGEYYVSCMSFSKTSDYKNGAYIMYITSHSLCNEVEACGEDRDYLSLEMVVYLVISNSEVEFEPNFSWAAI